MTAGRREYLAFAALALLLGPLTSFTASQWTGAMLWQIFAGSAILSTLAGATLVLVAFARRESPLSAREWSALLLLLLPQCLDGLLSPPYVRAWPWLHETGWGVAFLIGLASPLWLALLSALQLVTVEVPRAVVGATIVGIDAVCLVIPVDAWQIAPNQWLVLLAHLLLSIALVYVWTFACSRLASAGILSAAGCFLLLQAFESAALSALFERHSWRQVDWHTAAVPLLLGAVVSAASALLWFWLLQRMRLAAFSLYPLAIWVALETMGFLLFSFMILRLDIALAIAAAALVFALRNSGAGEQKTLLGLEHR